MDRIDLWLDVPAVEYEKLSDSKSAGENSKIIQERVIKAREIQNERFKDYHRQILTNSEMGVRELKKFVSLPEKLTDILNQAAKRLDLSARAYHRVIKLARTIADLEESENVSESHLFEALQYRPS